MVRLVPTISSDQGEESSNSRAEIHMPSIEFGTSAPEVSEKRQPGTASTLLINTTNAENRACVNTLQTRHKLPRDKFSKQQE
ncbi:hypothetical protein ACSS6W_000251 [Trichoderma asperelloides]